MLDQSVLRKPGPRVPLTAPRPIATCVTAPRRAALYAAIRAIDNLRPTVLFRLEPARQRLREQTIEPEELVTRYLMPLSVWLRVQSL